MALHKRGAGLNAVHRKLLAVARKARGKAYAPYSRFKVGAAVLMSSGKIYSGCNVENASYGLTCCAERTAIFKAISEGERRLVATAVVLDAPTGGAPCGPCRQVLYEFGPNSDVVLGNLRGAPRVVRLEELLPLAFGPRSLNS